MKSLRAMYKTEIKMATREFSGVLFGVMLPVGLMLLLGILYGNQILEGQNYSNNRDGSFCLLKTKRTVPCVDLENY